MSAAPAARASGLLAAAGVLAALAILGWRLAPMLASSHGDFDAVHLYLPLARAFLEQGLAFFGDARSIRVPPLDFLYPALLGAELARMKVANALLGALALLAVFRCGWLLHSRAAGVAAALLFACSPTLRMQLATPITESPYILFGTLWLWGLAEWRVRGRRWGLAASAAAILMATLTRATMFYAIVVLVALSAVLAWRARGELRDAARAALLAYGAALAAVGLLIVKNVLLFGFPFFTTGAGNALYLGHNPLTGGYDPNYLGLLFDVGAVAREQHFLSLEAERLLRGAAGLILAERDWAFLAELHLRKLAAFVFVTGAEPGVAAERAWRVALVVLSATAWRAAAPATLRWALFGMLAYQVAIHMPAVYTHRYSVDAMDAWLSIAAGIGVAHGLQWRPRWKLAATLAVAALGMAWGHHLLDARPAAMPDVFAVPRVTVWQAPAPLAARGGEAIDLALGEVPRLSPYNNHVVVVDVAPGAAQRCDRLELRFRRASSPDLSAPIVMRLRGARQRYQFGTAALGLEPRGTLRVEARCAAGAVLEIQRLALFGALGASDYRARVLGEPAPAFLER